jgi:hypothetical protein
MQDDRWVRVRRRAAEARYELTLEAISSVPWLGAGELAHQGLKACLDKMLVEG